MPRLPGPAGWLAVLAAALVLGVPAPAPAADKCGKGALLEYDPNAAIETLLRKKRDLNGDGICDETVFYKNELPEHAEVDTNYDGKIDLWIRYDLAGKEIAQERDTNFDGKVDQWTTLEDGKPKVQRNDKHGDGKPESVTYYENGERTRSEEDTNGDGRIDQWITYAAGKPAKVETDTDGDGKVDVRAEFGADGNKTVELQDTDRDGRFDVTI